MDNLNKTHIFFSMVILILVIVAINSRFSTQDKGTKNQGASVAKEIDSKGDLNLKRRPASAEMIKAEIYEPEIKRTAVKKTNFQDTPDRNADDWTSPHFNPVQYNHDKEHATNDVRHQPDSHLNEASPHSEEPAKKTDMKKETQSVPGPHFIAPEKKETKVVKKETISLPNTLSYASPDPDPNICTASLSGGSFNHPIGVTLSCSSASVITYCLGKDTGSGCCDPRSTGTTYTSKINIGASDANYCLSFYGDSATLGLSEIQQNNYTINSTLPDLQIGFQQNYYQTTQLSGKMFLSSLEFGKAGFGAGVINLKAHDPGVLAENLKCDEIIHNYVQMVAPAPLDILSLLDVSLENPANQLEIPLRLDQMDYGVNFITAYMLNDNYDLPVYSCSTSEVVLSDFEFFEQQLTFGDPGNNSMREFTGGLTSFGFFEPDATLYRGPAGDTIEDQAGQRLQYGMLGIFF